MMDRIAYNLREMFATAEPGRYSYFTTFAMDNPMFAHFMDIDISAPTFEIPLFCLHYFKQHIQELAEEAGTSRLIAPLSYYGMHSSRKAVPSIVAKDVFLSRYSKKGLYKIGICEPHIYYGTQGVIFDKDMKVLTIASWQFSRWDDDSPCGTPVHGFVLKRPILRISPQVYLNKEDSVQSFIANKLLKTFLEHNVFPPFHSTSAYMDIQGYSPNVQAILEESPFKVTSVPVPNVNVTQQNLIDTVAENINDLKSLCDVHR